MIIVSVCLVRGKNLFVTSVTNSILETRDRVLEKINVNEMLKCLK